MDRSFLWVGLGGFIGTIIRHYVGFFLSRIFLLSFPYATLFVNVAGCLLIGILYEAAQKYTWFSGNGWLFLAVGVCGGFTTFSAFSLEGILLFQDGKHLDFFAYLALSIVLCFGATWLGMILFRSFG